jgi:DNA-binding transcriptional regulator YiaG
LKKRQGSVKVPLVTDTQVLRLAEVRAAVTSGEAERLRTAAQLSIGEVARACGVDQSTVWRWERGTRRPRGEAALLYGQLIDSLRTKAALAPSTRETA